LAPDAPATEGWTRNAPVEEWRAYVRAAYASNPGQCPLDVNVDNIYSFNQGSMSFIEQDLRVLPEAMARQALDAMDRVALRDAFDLRRNVVNLKKVLLHSWHTSEPLEKELRRMSTFWRGDMSWDNGFLDAARYRDVCVAHMRCKGAAHAVFDGRVMTKAICCVPRHPELPRPAKLSGLPRTMTTHSWLDQALDTLAEMDKENLAEGADSPGADEGADSSAKGVGRAMTGSAAAKNAAGEPSDVRRQLDAFLADATSSNTHSGPLRDWPRHILQYVELVLVARGGAKALSVRAETERYARKLRETSARFDEALRALRERVRSVEDVLRDECGVALGDVGSCPRRFVSRDDVGERAVDALRVAMRRDKTLNLLEGCAPATAELSRWVDEICAEPSTRLFVAGDAGTNMAADFVPPGFALGALIGANAKEVSARWGPELRLHVESASGPNGEWPPTEPLTYVTGKVKCVICGGSFGTLWIGAGGCCFRCEENMRARMECPVSARCRESKASRRWFCPHSRRCVACERWSCEECGVVCGDGEDVAALVEQIDPHVVFIDFDRTLCTTKSGSSPARGSHRLDAELWNVVTGGRLCRTKTDQSETRDVRVVTRNSHVDDIRAFMARHVAGGDSVVGSTPSLDAIPPVHHVGKGASKGRVIREVLEETAASLAGRLNPEESTGVGGGGVRAVFVDDSAAELLDPEVASVPGLTKVLFSRVLA